MAYIQIGTVNLHIENDEVFITSNNMANFLAIDHKNLIKEIDKYPNNIGKQFEACCYIDALNYKKHVLWYNIEREGCLLLLKNLKADQKEKENLSNIMRMI